MPRTSNQPLNPDELNRLWDMTIDATAGERVPAASPEASIIGRLQAFAPAPNRARIDHLRTRVDSAIATSGPRPTFRGPAVLRALDGRFATGALIVAVVAAMILAWPLRGFWQPDHEPGNGADPAPGQSVTDFPPNIGRSLVSILSRPADDPSGSTSIGLWDVTMPPGTVLLVPAWIQELGNQSIEAWVDEGAILVGASGFEHEVATGATTAVEPAPTYFRNAGSVPARLFLLAPMTASDAFPLRFTDWPGAGASSTPTADYSGSGATLFDAVTLNATDASQFRVTASVETFEPGAAVPPFNMPERQGPTIHSATVLSGEVTVTQSPAGSTPSVAEILTEGDTLLVDGEGTTEPQLQATGTEHLAILTLGAAPWSSNPTLDQTVDPVAPFWGEWTVPASGEVNLAIRSLMLEPGARYELPSDAGIFYFIPGSELVTTNVSTGATGPLGPGSIVAQLSGEVIRFENDGPDTVRLVQAIVFSGDLEEVTAAEPTAGIEAQVLVQVADTLPAGDASLMLEAHEYNGANDGGSSGSGSPSLVLVTAIDGTVQVRRDGGDSMVVTSPGAEATQPDLGQNVTIAPEGYMLVLAQGAWAVTGGAGEPSIGLVLSVSPMVDATAGSTPEATPGADPGDTITFQGDADACDVTPLAGSDIANLMATPAVNDDPLSRSARERTDGISDPETTEAITVMLQGYVYCVATGEYARSTAFYSDQAIRESDTLQDLVTSGYAVGKRQGIFAAVEDVVLFPDGRAGARAVIDGEAAYLTFVFEDGRWVIDVWDDSEGGPPITATPPK